MGKKMFQQKQTQTNHHQPPKMHPRVSTITVQNYQNQTKQTHIPNNSLNHTNQKNQKHRLNSSLNLNIINNQNQPSYRIESYQIENKTYRLISLNETQQKLPRTKNHQHNQDNNQLDNSLANIQQDFRQPANSLIVPKINPISNQRRINRRNQQSALKRYWQKLNPFSGKSKPSDQSFLSYLKKLLIYVKSVQISSCIDWIPFIRHHATLESKYRLSSMAILNNSISLQAAVIKGLEYNIPLMQIIMNSENIEQQRIVREKILQNFTVAHFINQNFVLYGDWNYQKYRQIFYIHQKNRNQNKSKCEGKILFRKGETVFAQIDIGYVHILDQNELQQKLQEIRNFYYTAKNLCKNSNQSTSSENRNLSYEQKIIPKNVQQDQINNINFSRIQEIEKQVGSNGPIYRDRLSREDIEFDILTEFLEQRKVFVEFKKIDNLKQSEFKNESKQKREIQYENQKGYTQKFYDSTYSFFQNSQPRNSDQQNRDPLIDQVLKDTNE